MFYILIVDSNADVLSAAESMVSDQKCQVVAVTDFEQALGALTSITFDVLIAGPSSEDPNIEHFILDAKARFPALRIVAGASYARDSEHAWIVDAHISTPLAKHELRAALRIALAYVGTRLPVQASPGKKANRDI